MDKLSSILSGIFFEYQTPKVVSIRSRKIGLLNRFVQFAIVGYIVGFAVIYKKGYQEFDDIESAVTTKVKGIAESQNPFNTSIPWKIWDVADYIIPPQETNAFFVTTRVHITPNQTQGLCAEYKGIPNSGCTTDKDCFDDPNETNLGNGIKTGKCLLPEKLCEVKAWCPVEDDEGTAVTINTTKHFTVLIKNWISFPKFNAQRRNILDSANDTYLRNCKYQRDTDPFCPIFELKTVIEETGQNFETISQKGGIVAIRIHWDCNLDFNIDDCRPAYSFSRLDDPNVKLAPGWNFRYAQFTSGDVLSRDLYKVWGIRFVIHVTGQAGKFNIVPLLLNIGSGMALLGLATVMCDIIVLYLFARRDFYREKKYLKVQDMDSYEGFSSDMT